jgi:hypothetical protein
LPVGLSVKYRIVAHRRETHHLLLSPLPFPEIGKVPCRIRASGATLYTTNRVLGGGRAELLSGERSFPLEGFFEKGALTLYSLIANRTLTDSYGHIERRQSAVAIRKEYIKTPLQPASFRPFGVLPYSTRSPNHLSPLVSKSSFAKFTPAFTHHCRWRSGVDTHGLPSSLRPFVAIPFTPISTADGCGPHTLHLTSPVSPWPPSCFLRRFVTPRAAPT